LAEVNTINAEYLPPDIDLHLVIIMASSDSKQDLAMANSENASRREDESTNPPQSAQLHSSSLQAVSPLLALTAGMRFQILGHLLNTS
jgi:hypothetical protein